MKTRIKYIIVGLLLVTITAVGFYYYLNPKKALNFVVPSFNGLANIAVQIKNDTAYLDVRSVMENKAPYTIHIKNLTYTVCLNGIDIVSEEHALNLEQEPGQKDTANLLIRLPYKAIREVIMDIQDQDSTEIGLTVNITYETIFGEITVPAVYNTPIKTPHPPIIELSKIRMGFFNFKEKRFQLILDIDVDNFNEIQVELAKLNYNAEFGDNLTGYGKLDEVLTVRPNTRTNISLPLVINIDKPMKVIWDIITNRDRMDYTLNLEGKLLRSEKVSKDIPFNVSLNGNAELVK